MSTKRDPVNGVLIALLVLDASLAVIAYFFPGLWFLVFHDTFAIDPFGFLKRCGGNWAAFAVLQAIALKRWKKEPWWLAVVAGARLGDVFTDISYVLFAQQTTLFARIVFPACGPVNLLAGWWLLKRYLRIKPRQKS